MKTIDYKSAIKGIEDTIKQIVADAGDKTSALIASDKLAEDVGNALQRGIAEGFAVINARLKREEVPA